MTHGTQDWNLTNAPSTTFGVRDLGELAARLGSVDRFDRRGDVLFIDGFEDGIGKWFTTAVGAASRVAPSAKYGRSGAWSARCTQDPGGGAAAQLTHYEPFPVLSRMGVEFSYTVPVTTGSVELSVNVYDGANRTLYDLLISYATGVVQYINSAGALTTLAGAIVPTAQAALFHTVKLVFDAAAKKYVRALIDNQAIDMSAFGAWVTAVATPAQLQATLSNNGRAGNTDTVYFDDVIITQNEP